MVVMTFCCPEEKREVRRGEMRSAWGDGGWDMSIARGGRCRMLLPGDDATESRREQITRCRWQGDMTLAGGTTPSTKHPVAWPALSRVCSTAWMGHDSPLADIAVLCDRCGLSPPKLLVRRYWGELVLLLLLRTAGKLVSPPLLCLIVITSSSEKVPLLPEAK